MNAMFRRRTVLGAGVGTLAAPTLARSQAATVNLTVWSWVPRLNQQTEMFERANPNVRVQVVNAGQSLAQHMRLRNALRAGTGAPDLAHLEYFMLPSFQLANALVDLAPHGAAALRDQYVGWTWDQVSDGGRVWAMPGDSGPLGLIYRGDVFGRAGIEPPRTWAEFGEAALRFRRANPDAFLTNLAFASGNWVNALFWQAGSRPFEVDGTNIRIAVNDAPARRVCEFWQPLIAAGAVDTKPIFTTEWYASLDAGRYASWISAAWGPLFLSQFVRQSAGQWRVSAIPQWTPGGRVSGNWGGSTLAVIRQTRFPREAAALAMFLSNNRESANLFIRDQFLFPVLNDLLSSEEFASQPSAFYGNQAINRVFIESARQVDTGYRWSPFQDYVNTQMGNELGAAASGGGSLVAALDRLQDNLVRYARSQGFTVRT